MQIAADRTERHGVTGLSIKRLNAHVLTVRIHPALAGTKSVLTTSGFCALG